MRAVAAEAATHFDSVEVLQNDALLGWCLEQPPSLAGVGLRPSLYMQTLTERL